MWACVVKLWNHIVSVLLLCVFVFFMHPGLIFFIIFITRANKVFIHIHAVMWCCVSLSYVLTEWAASDPTGVTSYTEGAPENAHGHDHTNQFTSSRLNNDLWPSPRWACNTLAWLCGRNESLRHVQLWNTKVYFSRQVQRNKRSSEVFMQQKKRVGGEKGA